MARSRKSSGEVFHAPGKADLSPVYLLHGEEDLLREEALNAILDVAVPPEHRSFNLDIVEWADIEVKDIIARASAYPMMAERRAVVVKGFDKVTDKDEIASLTSYVEHPVETTVLVLTAVKVDLAKNPFARIKNSGWAHKFESLKETELPGWISRRLAAKGRTIDPDANKLLASLTGFSLRDLDQELEKLVSYAGERTLLTPADVSAVVGVSKEFNIWELQHAIAVGERSRAVEILTRMVADGNGAPYFTVMLTMFFANVRLLHDFRRKDMSIEQAAAELQRNAWVLRDAFEATKHFTSYQIEKALALLLTVDDKTKFGGDDLTLLQTFLVEIFETPVPSR